jgi:tripartite-type tricarboxylate transporter receptor subunit TctC
MKRLLLALAAAGAAACAAAQEFPAHPVRIIVPWPPSGNVDITARAVAPAFGEALGAQVIVENVAGAGGRIGTAAVAKSPADGYTLLLGSSGTVTAGPAVFKNLSYDPLKDFVPIAPIQYVAIVLTAAPKTPIANYREFVAYAEANPGKLSIASAGNGSSNHLAIELLMRQAHLKLLHVPYKGSGPALTDLLGSQVECMMDQLNSSVEQIKNGRIKALAVASLKRSPLLPEVPTFDEFGLKGFEATTFSGIFAPAGTPGAAVTKLAAALHRSLANQSVRERFRQMGVEVMDMTPSEFTAFVHTDYEKWRTIAREGHIVVD